MVWLGSAGEARCSAATPRPGSTSWPRGYRGASTVTGARPAGLGGSAHSPCAPLRPRAGGPHVSRRVAAASAHSRLRGDAAAPAVALPARRQPGRGQDHHGRVSDQVADRPRRPGAVSDRLPRHPCRAVARQTPPRFPVDNGRRPVPNTPPCSCWTRRRDVRRSACCGSAGRRSM